MKKIILATILSAVALLAVAQTPNSLGASGTAGGSIEVGDKNEIDVVNALTDWRVDTSVIDSVNIVTGGIGNTDLGSRVVSLSKQATGTANRLQGFDGSGNPSLITVSGIAALSAGNLAVTEVDGSITNELQTVANTSDATSHTVTLSNSGGSVQLVEGSNITLTTTGTSGAGVVTIASTGVGESTTASNGLTLSGVDVKLGGTLSANTAINGNFDLKIGNSTALDTVQVVATKIVLNGAVTSVSDITVPTEAYDATGWNGNLTVPTKDAVRDKIEALSSGTAWVLTGQNITAESSIGSNDAFGVNIETNNVNRLRLSSAGRFFTGTLTDINLVASDSVKLTGATMDLAPTAELKVTSGAQTGLRSIGGFHSYVSATSGSGVANVGYLWENSADANDGYVMRREADGKFFFARASDYPYSTEIDSIFTYDQTTNTFDFDVTNLTQNGVTLLNGTSGDATYWKLGGQTVGANANIGPTDAFRFGIGTNGSTRLSFSSDGRIFSTGNVTDLKVTASDSIYLNGSRVDIVGATQITGNLIMTADATVTGRMHTSMGATVASAGDLTLGNDGNSFPVSGTTTVNAITTTGWQAGDVVIINATTLGTCTFKHNTAGGANTAPMVLFGSVDFVMTAPDVLGLRYDGTNWVQIFGTP